MAPFISSSWIGGTQASYSWLAAESILNSKIFACGSSTTRVWARSIGASMNLYSCSSTVGDHIATTLNSGDLGGIEATSGPILERILLDAAEEGNLLASHPTVKPVLMAADAILDCSVRGDIILDPFLGSGTTVLAAERTGRRCFGMEIDPTYVDLVIRRWQTLTGGDATHVSTGKRFTEIEERRNTNNGS